MAIIKAQDFEEVQKGNLTLYEVKKGKRRPRPVITEKVIQADTPPAKTQLNLFEPSGYFSIPAAVMTLIIEAAALDQIVSAQEQQLKTFTQFKERVRAFEVYRIQAEEQRILANREIADMRTIVALHKEAKQKAEDELKILFQQNEENQAKVIIAEKGAILLKGANEALRSENERLLRSNEELRAANDALNAEYEEMRAGVVPPINIPEMAVKDNHKSRLAFLRVNGSRHKVDIISA
jgi:hypothetical protein